MLCVTHVTCRPSTTHTTSNNQSAIYLTANDTNNITSLYMSQTEYENTGADYQEIAEYAEIKDGTSQPYANIEYKQSFDKHQKPVSNDLHMGDQHSSTDLHPESDYLEPVSKI